MWCPSGHHNIGGNVELNEYSIVAISVDKVDGPDNAIVKAYLNYELVGTKVIDVRNLDNHGHACLIGDWKDMSGHKFDGQIDYVNIWYNSEYPNAIE